MFENRVKKEEKRIVRDVIKIIWRFWTSPTGGVILALSAIAIGYYQFYISRPILRYDLNTVKLISSQNTNDYAVVVGEKKYQDLYLTKVYLYNMGKEALSGLDVSHVGRDPIRIEIPKEAGMQHFNIDNEETTKAISAEIVPYGEDLVLNFDFLNPEYQYVVNILHTNLSDGIKVSGSALNVNSIKRAISGRELKHLLIYGLGLIYVVLILRYIIKKKIK